MKKIVREHINEILIGRPSPYFTKEEINIPLYKNPKSLDNMSPWTRAISTKNGDVYVGQDYRLLHHDIIRFLCKKKILNHPPNYYETLEGYKNIIFWQRNKNTNKFYLTESYPEKYLKNEYVYEEMLKMYKNINLHNIKFVFQKVPSNKF